MKTGDKALIFFTMFFIGAIIGKKCSAKKLEQYSDQPSIFQYLNRLIEFYPISDIQVIEKEFLNLIDFGLSPQSAFSAMTQSEIV